MSRFQALTVPAFRRFWIAQAISHTGSWMQTAAQAWLVLSLTGSGERLGLVAALQYLPSLFLSIPAGVISDRYSRRKVMIATQSVMLALSMAMAVLVLTGAIRYPHVIVFAVLYGCANALGQPVRQAFAIELATTENISSAVPLNSLSFNASRMIGPALAGFVILVGGTGWAFGANTLSFVPLLVLLLRMREPAAPPALRGGSAGIDAAAGLRYVWGERRLRAVMLLLLWLCLFAINMPVLVPLYAWQVLHADASNFGLLMSCVGLGALCSALWQAYTAHPHPRRMIVGAVALGALYLCLSLVGSLVVAMIAFGAVGFAMVTVLSTGNALVQTAVPNALRGRVMAVYMLITLGTNPAGGYLTGLAFEMLGGRWATAGLGALTLAGVLLLGSGLARQQVLR